MKTDVLKKVLEKVTTWPVEAQEAALESLQVIEEDFVSDAAFAHDLKRAHGEAQQGAGKPQEEVFKRLGV